MERGDDGEGEPGNERARQPEHESGGAVEEDRSAFLARHQDHRCEQQRDEVAHGDLAQQQQPSQESGAERAPHPAVPARLDREQHGRQEQDEGQGLGQHAPRVDEGRAVEGRHDPGDQTGPGIENLRSEAIDEEHRECEQQRLGERHDMEPVPQNGVEHAEEEAVGGRAQQPPVVRRLQAQRLALGSAQASLDQRATVVDGVVEHLRDAPSREVVVAGIACLPVALVQIEMGHIEQVDRQAEDDQQADGKRAAFHARTFVPALARARERDEGRCSGDGFMDGPGSMRGRAWRRRRKKSRACPPRRQLRDRGAPA